MLLSFIEGYKFSKAVKLFKSERYESALKIFRDLSKKSAMSNYYLGIAYSFGYGCKNNFYEANQFFKRSYELQNKTAAFHVAYTFEKMGKWDLAEEWYVKIVSDDEPRKYFRLAKIYKDNKIPEQDPRKIEDLLKTGASMNEPAAMYLLAELYIDEKRNLEEAKSLLLRSKNMGLDRSGELLKQANI